MKMPRGAYAFTVGLLVGANLALSPFYYYFFYTKPKEAESPMAYALKVKGGDAYPVKERAVSAPTPAEPQRDLTVRESHPSERVGRVVTDVHHNALFGKCFATLDLSDGSEFLIPCRGFREAVLDRGNRPSKPRIIQNIGSITSPDQCWLIFYLSDSSEFRTECSSFREPKKNQVVK